MSTTYDEDDAVTEDTFDPMSSDAACRELAFWVFRNGLLSRARADGYGESAHLDYFLQRAEEME